MSIRLVNRHQCYSLVVMFSRCISSVSRSINQHLSRKKYHLVNNSIVISNHRFHCSNIIYELSLTFSLALFLFYLFYQMFGNFILIIFIIFGILSSLYGLQDALLYQPNEPDTARLLVQTPDSFHMPYEVITIETADKEKLHGFLIKQIHRADQCETLVFFHGNAGNIGHRLQNTHLLYRGCQINILLFDYRGYGKSTGTPSEAGLYLDAHAVYDYVRNRPDLNQEKIFFFGRSLGGAVALHLASHLAQVNAMPPLYAVIVENTFTSIADMAKRLFQVYLLDYVPIWCYKNVFSSISKIRHITVPLLFLSGGQDELVPPQMMQKLHEECPSSNKHLIVFADGQHNTTWLSNNYTNQIRHFLTGCSTSPDPTISSFN